MSSARPYLPRPEFNRSFKKKTGFLIPFTIPRSTLALLILPSVYFALVSIQFNQLKPLLFGVGTFDYDAAYTYLISSVSLTLGDIPNYADHPGTLNHILLAFALRISQIVSAMTGDSPGQCSSTSCLAIDHPEQVLGVAGGIGLLFFDVSIFFLGWSFYQTRTTSLPVAILSQSVFLSAPNLLPYAKIINGETTGIPCFLMAGGLIILTNHLNESKTEGDQLSRQRQALGGSLSGLYMSFVLLAKLSFLPTALLLAMHRSRLAFVSSLIALTIGFYFWGLRLTNWRGFKKYWFSITSHTGSYGTGTKGMIDWHRAFANLGIIFHTFSWLFLVVGLLIIAIVLTLFCVMQASARAELITRSFLLCLSVMFTVYGFVYATSNFRSLLFGIVGVILAWAHPFAWRRMTREENDWLYPLIAIFLVQSLSILSVLKHYDIRYLAVPIGVSAIGVGVGLGALERIQVPGTRIASLSKFLHDGLMISLTVVISIQGLTLAQVLNKQILERNTIMASDQKIIHWLRKAYPNSALIGEYRLKGFNDYALAFAFLMGTSQEKASRIMAAYHDPERRYWIWLSRDSKFWNQIDGKMTTSEFRKLYGKQSHPFIFALPNQVLSPDLPLRKVAELGQNASVFVLPE
jgi:hypothetical protein